MGDHDTDDRYSRIVRPCSGPDKEQTRQKGVNFQEPGIASFAESSRSIGFPQVLRSPGTEEDIVATDRMVFLLTWLDSLQPVLPVPIEELDRDNLYSDLNAPVP